MSVGAKSTNSNWHGRHLLFIAVIIFSIIPLAQTQYLADSFTVIKWLITFGLSGYCAFHLYQKRVPKVIFYATLPFLALRIGWGQIMLPHAWIEGLVFLSLIFWFFSRETKYKDVLITIEKPLLVGCSFAVIRSIFQIYQCRILHGIFETACFSSTFGNGNHFAEYLLLTLPLLIYFYLFSNFPQKSKKIHLCLIVISLVLLLLLQGRSTLMGVSFLLAIWFTSGYWRQPLSWCLVLSFAIAGALYGYWWDIDFSAVEGKYASLLARWELMVVSWSMLTKNFWGYGFDYFEFGNIPFRLESSANINEFVLDRFPHNELLKWGISFGWIYLALCLIAILFILLVLIKMPPSEKKTFYLSGAVVWLPQMMFHFPFENAFSFCFAALYLGLLMADNRLKISQWGYQMITRPVGTLVAIVISAHLMCLLFSKLVEVSWSQSAPLSHIACSIDASNWRACLNEISALNTNKKWEESILASKKELSIRPANYFIYAEMTSAYLGLNLQQEACLSARKYRELLSQKGNELGPYLKAKISGHQDISCFLK